MTKGLLPYQKVIYEKGFEAGFKEGYKINFEKGFLQDSRESILDNLEERFLVVPSSLKEKITIITNREVLRSLRKVTIRVSSLEEFEKVVNEARK